MDFQLAPFATVIFLATIALSLYTLLKDEALYHKMLLHPFSMIRDKEWHRIITSGMIHANFMHLGFNMWAFFVFAFYLEQIVGPIEFIVIYFGSMAIADIPTIVKHKDDPYYRSVGASGAISGIVFSFILFHPLAGLRLLFIPIDIPAIIFGILYIAYSYYAASKSSDMINHSAHLWGALAGIVLTILLKPGVVPYFFEQLF